MTSLSPTIRPIGLDGVRQLVDWARMEGWNPGPFDAEVFYQTDPDGFVGCFIEERMIGGGSIVSYNGQFGFMGFFIMIPEFRAQGLGRSLWISRRDLLMSRLSPGATIGMDGVVAMQGFYQRGGFQIAFRDERYERIGSPLPVDERVSLGQDIHATQQLDRKCFGFDRTNFLKAWLELPDSTTFSFTESGVFKGYAHLRKAHIGYKIGPLFAETPEAAQALYEACLNEVPGEPVYLDIPASNEQARSLVQRYNAKFVFECARMYHGPAPALPMNWIYGVTSFELG